MKHLQNWYDSAVLGIVAVAKPCEAARRCVHLQGWHDCAVEGIVAVAKPCGAARRSMQLQDWHDCAVQGTELVEILWRSAKMLALQDVQDCAVRGAVLAKNLAMQHDDACTCKTGTTARCNAPWR